MLRTLRYYIVIIKKYYVIDIKMRKKIVEILYMHNFPKIGVIARRRTTRSTKASRLN